MDVKAKFDQETKGFFHTEQIPLGPWTSESYMHDPKHIAFVASRYKFAAKMLQGRKKVMEVGCGDAFGLPIVAQAVEETLYAVDWEERFITDNAKRMSFLKNVSFIQNDMNCASMPDIKVSAIYLIDVIEHIDPRMERAFLDNTIVSFEKKEEAVMIIGTPNLTASKYASPQSEALHINLKSHETLYGLLSQYFYNVFMFGMNDEVVHTGYSPMCQYLWGMGIGLR